MPYPFRPPYLDPHIVPTLGPVRLIDGHPLGPFSGLWIFGIDNRDYSIFANDATPNFPPAVTNTESGPAYNFNGTQYLSANDTPPLDPALPFSVAMRLKYTSSAIITTLVKGFSGAYQVLVPGTPYTTGAVACWVGSTAGQGAVTQSAWNDGKTHDFLFVFTATTSNVFVDGIDNTSVTSLPPGTPAYDSVGLYFGSNFGGNNYVGNLSRVILFPFALSAAQAAQLAAEPFGMLEYDVRRTWVSVPSGIPIINKRQFNPYLFKTFTS